MTLKVGMQHRVLEYYQVCSNDDPELILTYFMTHLSKIVDKTLQISLFLSIDTASTPLKSKRVGVGVLVASCLYPISSTNGWILTKLAQTHYREGKEVIRLDDFDLIFKVTPALWNFQILTNNCTLLNQITDSGQTSYIVTLGWFKDLIRFWWPWPKFSRSPHYTGCTFFKFWLK